MFSGSLIGYFRWADLDHQSEDSNSWLTYLLVKLSLYPHGLTQKYGWNQIIAFPNTCIRLFIVLA